MYCSAIYKQVQYLNMRCIRPIYGIFNREIAD